jgi:tetratricopeptide (TPR) repeat protein
MKAQTATLKDKNYTKRFRILYSIGKCLRLMNFAPLTPIGRMCLNFALDVLPDTDDLNIAWSYLELALCSSTSIKAEECFDLALNRYDSLRPICQAHCLFEYGRFMYKQGHHLEAVKQYCKLEKLLEDKDFEYLKALNYYNIYIACSDPDFIDKEEIDEEIEIGDISIYLQKFQKACKKLSLPCRDLPGFSF